MALNLSDDCYSTNELWALRFYYQQCHIVSKYQDKNGLPTCHNSSASRQHIDLVFKDIIMYRYLMRFSAIFKLYRGRQK